MDQDLPLLLISNGQERAGQSVVSLSHFVSGMYDLFQWCAQLAMSALPLSSFHALF